MHNKKIGKYGEDLACQYLIRKGYKIIGRNIKISYQELDVVASIDNKIIFVEVKTRIDKNYEMAEAAMTDAKYSNLRKAICSFLDNNHLNEHTCRLDLVAIYINKPNKMANIKHYIDII